MIKNKIGILGGSFNPAHQGHIHISLLAIKKLKLHELWWIPNIRNPFKNKINYLDFHDRISNCKAVTQDYKKIKVKQINNFYTYDLIKNLKKIYKKNDFIWIMGADNLENFHKWFKFKNLICEIEFAIFARENYFIKNHNYKAIKIYRKLQNNQKKLPKINIYLTPKNNLSSTKINQKNHA
jgi:nicotinate-nucleotide adenylyltransferase